MCYNNFGVILHHFCDIAATNSQLNSVWRVHAVYLRTVIPELETAKSVHFYTAENAVQVENCLAVGETFRISTTSVYCKKN